MGHWGIGLFQNDIGVETRDLYISLLKSVSSDEDAYRSYDHIYLSHSANILHHQ